MMDSIDEFLHPVEDAVEQNRTDSVKMCLTMMVAVVGEREMFLTDHCCLDEHCGERMETEACLVIVLHPSETEMVMLLMDLEMVEVENRYLSVDIVYDHLVRKNLVVDVDVVVKVMKENPFSTVAMEIMEESLNSMWI